MKVKLMEVKVRPIRRCERAMRASHVCPEKLLFQLHLTCSTKIMSATSTETTTHSCAHSSFTLLEKLQSLCIVIHEFIANKSYVKAILRLPSPSRSKPYSVSPSSPLHAKDSSRQHRALKKYPGKIFNSQLHGNTSNVVVLGYSRGV